MVVGFVQIMFLINIHSDFFYFCFDNSCQFIFLNSYLMRFCRRICFICRNYFVCPFGFHSDLFFEIADKNYLFLALSPHPLISSWFLTYGPRCPGYICPLSVLITLRPIGTICPYNSYLGW